MVYPTREEVFSICLAYGGGPSTYFKKSIKRKKPPSNYFVYIFLNVKGPPLSKSGKGYKKNITNFTLKS